MKKTMIAATAACALLAVPALAQADELTWYGDIGYTNVSVDEGDLDVNLGLIQGRVGLKFNPYFGVEGEAAFGIADDSVDVGGTDVNVEMKNLVAAYVVLNYPVNEQFDVWVRAGYARMEVEASAGGFSASEEGSDSAVGFGAAYYFSGKNGIRGDWTNYGGTDAFSVSYIRKF